MGRAIGGWFSLPCLKSRKSNDRHVPEKSPGKKHPASRSGGSKKRKGKHVSNATTTVEAEDPRDLASATATQGAATHNNAGASAMVITPSQAAEIAGSACGGGSHGGGGGGDGGGG